MADTSVQILSDITVYMKYARYLPEEKRRETWDEIVTRNMEMHIRKHPALEQDIRAAYTHVYRKEVLPSMRSMQFAGRATELNNTRLYNCSFLPVDHPDAFSEIFFLLLGGTGVGYSVQKQHVAKLPPVAGPGSAAGGSPRRYLIGDSIEGWADSIKVLVESYFYGKQPVAMDYRDIRPKGKPLVTSGGRAPGPGPLRECHRQVARVLDEALTARGAGTQLLPIEVHDIVCLIADAVLAGGIRRAALISLFSFDDQQMITCKSGAWWEDHPERARANNSAVMRRDRITEKDFSRFFTMVEESRSGEPGIFLTNDADLGTNPCSEISLRPHQFCNLTEINVSNLRDQEDFNSRARAAAFIGTLQASYTDFHYLRTIWKETTEKDALLGVSMTGIASGDVLKYDMSEAARHAVEENRRAASLLGINPAARVTTVKPSGTTSLVVGTSSGIHPWHNDHYVRRIRVGKNEPIYGYLAVMHPELVEDERFRPESMAVISVPVKAPEGAILRTESPLDTLERVKRVYNEWIVPGHISGANRNNISVTINLKDDEWEAVRQWMWDNRESYNGISVFPYDGGTYVQAPFEDITRAEYLKMASGLVRVDLKYVQEDEDNTDLKGEIACAGGACEVTSSLQAESIEATESVGA